jgi:ABC-type siderophore export system fused ATPase/permease subunit
MSSLTKYILYMGLTTILLCTIIYIVVKITTNIVIKSNMPKLKHRQSTIHNIVRDVLPTNEDIIKNIIMNRERSKQKKQSNQKYSQESYQTKVTEDGEIDQSSAKPVDTTNMSVEEIDRLMKIVDDLRGIGKNDGSSSGN